ncbi:hypothetical protein GDO81_029430 [Engystomops pustulosus]|uniref:Uncharacterized protein n=1 Tax=Engystomops pustulosus TaxID=76066 RepID=A0AAV6ZFE1_ENGPU|nr:hypothetical protein GDO81_029430 [Engystomops pustulosus]
MDPDKAPLPELADLTTIVVQQSQQFAVQGQQLTSTHRKNSPPPCSIYWLLCTSIQYRRYHSLLWLHCLMLNPGCIFPCPPNMMVLCSSYAAVSLLAPYISS